MLGTDISYFPCYGSDQTLLLQQFWNTFMQEVQGVANQHPYLVKPGASDYGGWALAGAVGSPVFIFFQHNLHLNFQV